jgi:hypothetical protein
MLQPSATGSLFWTGRLVPEHVRWTVRWPDFVRRWVAKQRRLAQQHAQADREAITRLAGAADVAAEANAVVARHEALAQQ